MLRVEGRLENANLTTDTKHFIILPSKHPLTRLIILNEHAKAGHAGPFYSLMRTRQRFWIVYALPNGMCKMCYAKSNTCSTADGRSTGLSSNCHK